MVRSVAFDEQVAAGLYLGLRSASISQAKSGQSIA
jgi:hypothetical protein